DLFLHGGLLARLYVGPSPFLLPADDAFRRIPFGYLTFLILTISLWAGQTVELALAGGVLGAAADRVPLKRICALVGVAVLVLAAATVGLQSAGLAPAMRVVP